MSGPPSPVLVAGVGNVFLGDDGFGVEVARRLDGRSLPDGVVVADYGIRGVHLAYDLLDGEYRTLILVDAVPIDEPPGTVVVLEVDPGATEDGLPAAVPDAHGMDPSTVLNLVRTLGAAGPGYLERIYVVGVRPACLDAVMGLSKPVQKAVDQAVSTVLGLLAEDPVANGRLMATGAD